MIKSLSILRLFVLLKKSASNDAYLSILPVKEIKADVTMKSYAFKMIFQSKTNTLKDSEIDTIIQKVLNKLKQNYNVVQR